MSGERLGIALALFSTFMLGLAVAVSRFAYEGGTNGLTVASLRSVLAVVWLYLYCRMSGRALAVPWPLWWHLAGLGLLMAVMFYGNVGAVEFISIGLAALLFFTFPPVIALINGLVLRLPVGPVRYLAVAIAFLGIAVMLGVSLRAVDPRGVVMSLAASLATAINAVWLSRRIAGKVDTIVATFHMALVACVALLAVSIPTGQIVIPPTLQGWLGSVAVAVLQASSFPLYFVSITLIGPLRCAMFSNIQPVVSIVAGFLFFGDLLTGTQLFGGALVLAGILLLQWQDRRAAGS